MAATRASSLLPVGLAYRGVQIIVIVVMVAAVVVVVVVIVVITVHLKW